MAAPEPDPDLRGRPLRSFGRQKGRALTARQQALMDTLLPAIALPAAPDTLFDPRALMPGASAVRYEIGFGGGEHLAAQARANPDILHLGAEPFVDGVAKLLTRVDEDGLRNVRVLHGDARPLLAALAPGSLDRLDILFPDPWHKARHNKRRLIQTAFLDDAARALRPGGELRFATDWAAYADWTLELALAHPAFDWMAARADDWRTPPPDHVTTRYETKALGDCAPLFLRFSRL
jgi:tRNA (guanine-N7-)-methyltransferase